MNKKEMDAIIRTVFSPRKGEKILFLTDLPHGRIGDSGKWKARRKMASEWECSFRKYCDEKSGKCEVLPAVSYEATGKNNMQIWEQKAFCGRKKSGLRKEVLNANIVLAMTKYSATSSLKPLCDEKGSAMRAASMPGVTKAMEKTALSADPALLKKHALSLKKKLDRAVGAQVIFSNKDKLHVDLRGREAEADTGSCSKPGMFINFPSGEAAKVPYEAIGSERKKFGKSGTEGVMPIRLDRETVRCVIAENRIVEVLGHGKEAMKLRKFFEEKDSRRNIAELGLGCNPKAKVRENVLEDEKAGPHIAYGHSAHIGGKNESDVHEDTVFAKDSPIKATVVLEYPDGSREEVARKGRMLYERL